MNTDMNRYAVITGASGGIGSAIAIKLAEEGWNLLLIGGRQTSRLTETASLCQSKCVSVDCLQTDFADIQATSRMLSQLQNFCGQKTGCRPVSLLINCAGVSHIGLMTDMSPDEWHRILEINLSSVYSMCHAVLPSMIHEKKGRILNISSVWGNVGASCEVAYSATKGGIHAFTKALAKELAPSGIAVNALACGMIDTAMNHCFTGDEIASICEEIPAGRMGSPQEVADMVSLLARAPVYVTGQIIGIDGGWQAS